MMRAFVCGGSDWKPFLRPKTAFPSPMTEKFCLKKQRKKSVEFIEKEEYNGFSYGVGIRRQVFKKCTK